MPFDISRAQPAKPTNVTRPAGSATGKFDPSKAQPARPKNAPAAPGQRHPLITPERQKLAEDRIRALDEERGEIAAQRTEEASNIEMLRPAVRTASLAPRAFLGPASLIEQMVVGGPNAFGAEIPTPFTDSYESFTPDGMGAGLENRDGLERAVDFTGEILTGAGLETKVAQGLQKLPGVARNIGDLIVDALADNPKAAAGAAVGAGAGGTAAREVQSDDFQAEHPIASQLITTAGAVAGGAPGAAAAGRGGAVARRPVEVQPPNEAQQARSQLGLVVAPSSATAVGSAQGARGTVARTLEGLAGTQNVKNRAAQKNAPKVEEAASRDVGMKEGEKVTDATLKAQAGPAHEVRKELVKLLKDTPDLDIDEELRVAVSAAGARRRNNPALDPTPGVERVRANMENADSMTVQQMLDAVSELRDDAKGFYQKGDRAAGKAARDLANAFENRLERAAVEAGDLKFATRFKSAREQLAKIHDLEIGRTRSGRLDPSKISRQKGKPSGGVKAIGDAGEAFPAETRPVTKLRNTSNRPDSLWGTIRNFAQDNVFDPMLGNYILGDKMQDALVGPAGMIERRPGLVAQPRPQQKGPQGDAFGGPLEFQSPGGAAGGQMPSDARRLNSTISDQIESQGPNADLASEPGLPGQMPTDARRLGSLSDHQNAIRLEEFELTPPEGVAFERRSSTEPYTGIEKRVNGVPDLTAERQRVLDRPIGTPANVGMADDILADPSMNSAVRGDTRSNRTQLNPFEPDVDLPIGGIEPGSTRGPSVSQFGEFERVTTAPRDEAFQGSTLRSNAGIGEMIGNERVQPGQGEISFTPEDLAALGFSPEEIAQILGGG